MTKRSPSTRQVNLMLTASQEEVVRLMVRRLREGGVEFEARVHDFLSEAPVPRYMHIDELDRRFGSIERRFSTIERRLLKLERPAAGDRSPSRGKDAG